MKSKRDVSQVKPAILIQSFFILAVSQQNISLVEKAVVNKDIVAGK
jgi:hypothetical protein